MKKLLIIFISGLALAFSACDKNFEEINTDPNSVSKDIIKFEKVFSTVELYTAGNSDGEAFEDERGNLIYCSLITQHFASLFYSQGDKYSFNDEYISAYWDANYPNSVKNISDIIANTKDKEGEENFYQIARIFRVFIFQRLTDLYGDIPYFEAGQAYTGGVLFPKYDKQQDIYADMLKELDEAAAALDESKGNTLGDQDIIYGGDVNKWKKFAYSEMTRLAMRMSKVAPDQAQTWVQKAVAGGVMASNDDNANVYHIAVNGGSPTNNGSGWKLIIEDNNNFKMSEAFINFFKSHNDPRLHLYAAVSDDPGGIWNTPEFNLGDTTSSIQLGMPNGYDPEGGLVPITSAPNYPGNVDKYSIPNRYLFAKADATTFFLTAAETQLLLAEAAERGWISGDAATIYKGAVELAFDQLSQTGGNWSTAEAIAQADAYLAHNPYSSATGLQQINEQYWAAVFMDEYEAFANLRRSGYPALTPVNYPNSAINTTGGTLPRRLMYPQHEASINAANFKDAVARMSDGNTMKSRVWWDVAP
jgi:hypothetical protein